MNCFTGSAVLHASTISCMFISHRGLARDVDDQRVGCATCTPIAAGRP
jgi:hypothetical protein